MKTVKTAKWFRDEILRMRSCAAKGPSMYGSAVMPILELYRDLDSSETRSAFQEALELMLRSQDESERAIAVDVCLAFFVFREVL